MEHCPENLASDLEPETILSLQVAARPPCMPQLLCLCLTPNLLCSIKSNGHFVNYYTALLSLIITPKTRSYESVLFQQCVFQPVFFPSRSRQNSTLAQ